MPFSQTVVPQRVTISEIYRDNAQNILVCYKYSTRQSGLTFFNTINAVHHIQEKTAVSSMIGLLQQLNQISVYASEVFAGMLLN